MQYVKIDKKDLILGAMLLISIVQLFVCYISWQSTIFAFILLLVAFRGRSKSEFTYLDIAVSFVLFFELILFFTTINSPPHPHMCDGILHMVVLFHLQILPDFNPPVPIHVIMPVNYHIHYPYYRCSKFFTIPATCICIRVRFPLRISIITNSLG